MEFSTDLSWLGITLQIFLLDILLGGDNALIIAAACGRLPRRLIPRAIAIGAVGAVVMRIMMALMAGFLMQVPLLKAVSGIFLALFAINLQANARAAASNLTGQNIEVDPDLDSDADFIGAAMFILLADSIMSLDNVVAIAAVAQGNLFYLLLGLGLSIPFIFYGSFILTQTTQNFPLVVSAGTALLGWQAGSLIISDPMWARWIQNNAEALIFFAPIALAIFVVAEGLLTGKARIQEGPLRLAAPVRTKAPAPVPALAAATVMPMKLAGELPADPVFNTLAIASPSGIVAIEASQTAEDAPKQSDRVMLLGLIALFLVVGGVLTTIIVMTANAPG